MTTTTGPPPRPAVPTVLRVHASGAHDEHHTHDHHDCLDHGPRNHDGESHDHEDPAHHYLAPGGTSGGRALWKAALTTTGLKGFKDTPYNITGSSSVIVDGPSKTIRFTVPSGSQRAEIERDVPKLSEGQTRYFRLTYVLPPSFPTEPRGFQLATQWKNDGTGSPPWRCASRRTASCWAAGTGGPAGRVRSRPTSPR
jgi:hypothetical protein